MLFFMGEIFILSLNFSYMKHGIFRDENEIFMHVNESFALEITISGMKSFVRERHFHGMTVTGPVFRLGSDAHNFRQLPWQLAGPTKSFAFSMGKTRGRSIPADRTVWDTTVGVCALQYTDSSGDIFDIMVDVIGN